MSHRDREAADWFARMRAPGAGKDQAAFEAWHRDPDNAAAYARTEADWRASAGISRARIDARLEASAKRGGFAAGGRWAIAAALVVALSLGVFWQMRTDRAAPQLAAPLTTDTIVPASEALTEGTFELADGSRVTLTDGAVLEKQFDGKQRRVILFGGRGRFEVAHDAERPFIVLGAGSRTTALGTVFEVDLRSSRPRVSLIEGSVEVASRNSDRAIRLRPGEAAEVVTTDVRLVPAMPAPTRGIMLDADRMPLGEIVARANAANPVEIRLVSPDLARLEVSGRFDIGDPAALARRLAAAFDLAAAEERPDLIFIGPKKPGG